MKVKLRLNWLGTPAQNDFYEEVKLPSDMSPASYVSSQNASRPDGMPIKELLSYEVLSVDKRLDVEALVVRADNCNIIAVDKLCIENCSRFNKFLNTAPVGAMFDIAECGREDGIVVLIQPGQQCLLRTPTCSKCCSSEHAIFEDDYWYCEKCGEML